VTAAVGRAWWGGEQGLDQHPQLIRHQVVDEGCHDPASCQTNPKRSETTSYMLANLHANRTGAMPILYRLA